MEEKVEPNLNDWEKAKFVPPEIYKEMGTRGYLAGYISLRHIFLLHNFDNSEF
jgi:hypothetical protein